ncbi:Zn-ribbon domain-containing OB-fold protein [Brevundimonas guildfordensis]|uniref:Zn-ribbon domain-containing OB-fold protein n=1 Tax=Brevundimonas guildfordensis TaxID=2762241 RepID=A0ABR8QWQ8_9CAUL|nr:Zn-ribbon domain-containing OB-fold protein [Brevundimonas guildfordensis]MBD7939966.1 Zn-ribbon domain-containing OB-fold protein [Brevundimonas guildfordensis]
MSDFRFAPIENPDTEALWAGLRDGRLLIQKCSACNAHRHPPSPICHRCNEGEHEWVEASGRGTVWSHSVVHEPLDGWPSEVPYTVVIVTLEEGVKIVSNLVEGSHEAVRIGAPVELAVTQGAAGVALPRFRLADAG